jgi:hypothetical protein
MTLEQNRDSNGPGASFDFVKRSGIKACGLAIVCGVPMPEQSLRQISADHPGRTLLMAHEDR